MTHKTIKQMRQSLGLTQKEFSMLLNIPLRTIQCWEIEQRNPPPYVIDLIAYYLDKEKEHIGKKKNSAK